MRRQVTTTEVRCDLCGGGISRPGAGLQAGPLDFCRRCRMPARACQSCGSLPTYPGYPGLVQTYGGNCLACWRLAMSMPRGRCLDMESGNDCYHSCDQLRPHDGAHHCPDCGANWGLR